MESGECVHTLSGHTGQVNLALFSSDGKYIVTASDYNTVKLWTFFTLQELIEKVNSRFKDNPLTDEECRENYLE